jgi:argininosuccinate lyase
MTDDPTDVGSLSDRIAAGAQFYRRPGARLSEPQSDAVERISETPAAYHAGYHAFDLAHAVMLVEEGLIPDEEGRAILRGLRELEDDDGDATDARAALGHGVHNGEAYLISEYGEDVGGWLHLGRSSHDLHGTAVRFVLRERLLEIGELLAELLETYADRAAETADAPIPTYTGLQHAQVGTIGFQLCAAAAPHGRDLERVVALYDRLNRSPAGAAVGTTSDFDLNRERVASLLGFDG